MLVTKLTDELMAKAWSSNTLAETLSSSSLNILKLPRNLVLKKLVQNCHSCFQQSSLLSSVLPVLKMKVSLRALFPL